MTPYGGWYLSPVEPSWRSAATEAKGGGTGDASLRRACREFEALLIREMLAATGLDDVLGSLPCGEEADGEGVSWGTMGTSVYAGEALEALARVLASRGMLGLGDLLYRRLGGKETGGG